MHEKCFMNDKIARCLAVLDSEGVKYRFAEHGRADTIEDVIALGLEGGDKIAKNLFVRDDKKLNYYVFTVEQSKAVSLRAAQDKMGSRKLSFASPEELGELLGLQAGSVTPLGYMNDSAKKVKFVIDRAFRGGEIGVHPLDSTATVWLEADALVALIRKHGNFVYYLGF